MPADERKPFWYIVADQSQAIFYESHARYGQLSERSRLENSVAREKITEMISDRGGRSFDSHGDGRHTLQKEKTGPKRQASAGFAKAIVQRLAAAKADGVCREYSLIAAPRFLGLLKKEAALAKLEEPFLTINKDVAAQTTDSIKELIQRCRP